MNLNFIDLNRILSAFTHDQTLYWDDLLPFVLPSIMFIFGNSSIASVLSVWLKIILTSSFFFGLIGLNAGHHHNNVFHDGDELRSLDFGIYQLASVVEKSEGKNYPFMTLMTYGNHTLHHFFPTVDNAVLPQLDDLLIETCLEFKIELEELPFLKLLVGHFKQLARKNTIRLKNE